MAAVVGTAARPSVPRAHVPPTPRAPGSPESAVRRLARRAGTSAPAQTSAAIAKAPGTRTAASKANPGWISACRARPTGSSGEESAATKQRDRRAREPEHRRTHDHDPDELRPRDAQRPQGGVIVRLEHHLSRHRLPDEQQGHEQGEDPKED